MLYKKMVEMRETLIAQANIVERMIEKSMKGLERNDEKLLTDVIANDEKEVNELEIRIDEQCMNIIALHQPEAKDLRMTMMVSKMTSDLERIADCAVNIAESARKIVGLPLLKPYEELPKMTTETIVMVKQSIAAFIDENVIIAKEVCMSDGRVDEYRDRMWTKLASAMCEDPANVERALHLLRIANNLEKIADISTNIAEETIYIAKGIVIKHHKDSI
jgi:phosphate transport system protein